MNKKYMIKIPLKHTKDVEYAKHNLQFSVNTMLYPYYISETSLLSMFTDIEEYPLYIERSRELIFNASLRALEFTYNKLNIVDQKQIEFSIFVAKFVGALAADGRNQLIGKLFRRAIERFEATLVELVADGM